MGQIICSCCCSKMRLAPTDEEEYLVDGDLYQRLVPVLPRTMKHHLFFCCDTRDLLDVNTLIHEAEEKGFSCCEFENCAMPNRTELSQLDMFIADALWVVIYFSQEYCMEYYWSEIQMAAAVEHALSLKRKNILLVVVNNLEILVPKILSAFPRVSTLNADWKETFFNILGKIPDHLSKTDICGCRDHLDLEKLTQKEMFLTSSDETPRIRRNHELGRSAIPEKSISLVLQMQTWTNIQMPVRKHSNSTVCNIDTRL